FAPARSAAELERQWQQAAAAAGRSSVTALLPPELPERLRNTLCTLAGGRGTAAHLDVAARRPVLGAGQGPRVRGGGTLGFDHAEVTRGGIPLDEIDPRTMQSKSCPGLFLCGEVIDVDGPIGGFNFQAAFATGRLAGLHA